MNKRGSITFDPQENYQGKDLSALFEGCEILASAEWPNPTKALPGVRLDMTYTKEKRQAPTPKKADDMASRRELEDMVIKALQPRSAPEARET